MTTTIINGVVQGRGLLHVREQQAANTAGGTFTTGAWRTRTLNTVVTNTITGASLASDLVTLPPGMYDVMWTSPATSCNAHITRIFNTTTSAQIALGQGAFATSASTQMSNCIGRAYLTLTIQSALRLEHYCASTRATDGFGRAANLDSQPEVYAEFWVRQLG